MLIYLHFYLNENKHIFFFIYKKNQNIDLTNARITLHHKNSSLLIKYSPQKDEKKNECQHYKFLKMIIFNEIIKNLIK